MNVLTFMKSKAFRSISDQSAENASSHFFAGSLSAAILFLFSSCVDNNSRTAYDYGPFDENGNYVEEWADNPKYSKERNIPPAISDLDSGMVAAHETPLPSTTPSPPSVTPPPPRPPIPSQQSSSSRTASTSKPKATVKPKATASTKASTSTKPKTTAAKPTAKPKVAATKPKPKVTSPTRVVVKKGDTLSELALRYKTSVTAIQKANGLRGTDLQIGKSLVIHK
jgi:LysM repeat protein